MELLTKAPAIDSKNAIKLIEDTLRRVDLRLVQHGERVAYILLKMLTYSKKYTTQDIAEICILSIFHDIGAYKTEEIDRMVHFETHDVLDHSIYGYLFLRYLSPLSARAEAVLYHHHKYINLTDNVTKCRDEALLIGLADRIDMLTQFGNFSESKIIECAGTKFDPAHVALFLECEKKYNIIENLKSNAYQADIFAYRDSLIFSDFEINQYLRMLSYSIDFRSEHTVTHTINTIGVSLEVAKKMGCTGDTLVNIYYGALLHDIGKISTPLEILEYPDKLSAPDMEIMKQHVSVTEEIICGIIDDDICQIAIRHHEKLDGSGYPHGITGECLTQSQRIVAVSDIISALQGKRSYKDPFPKEKILDIISKMSRENKICPVVCDLVYNFYDEIVENVKKRNAPVLNTYVNITHEYKSLLKKLKSLDK